MQQEARPTQFKINTAIIGVEDELRAREQKKDVHMTKMFARTLAVWIHSLVKHNGWHFHIFFASTYKAANVLWERANRNLKWVSGTVCLCVCCSHFHISKQFRPITMRLVDKLYVSACVCLWISCNLPSFPLCAHISTLLRYALHVAGLIRSVSSVFAYSDHSSWLYVLSVNVVRQTNCFFFLMYSLSRVPHGHTNTHIPRAIVREVCKIDGWLESWAHISCVFFFFHLCLFAVWRLLVQYLNMLLFLFFFFVFFFYSTSCLFLLSLLLFGL